MYERACAVPVPGFVYAREHQAMHSSSCVPWRSGIIRLDVIAHMATDDDGCGTRTRRIVARRRVNMRENKERDKMRIEMDDDDGGRVRDEEMG